MKKLHPNVDLHKCSKNKCRGEVCIVVDENIHCPLKAWSFYSDTKQTRRSGTNLQHIHPYVNPLLCKQADTDITFMFDDNPCSIKALNFQSQHPK